MKKILPAIILGFLMIGLLAPLANLAWAVGDVNLNDCCKISSKFNAFSVQVSGAEVPLQLDHKGICIVGAQGGSCIIDDVDYSNGLSTATAFTNANVKCGEIPGGRTIDYVAIEGWGMVCLLNTVYTVTNWVFYLMMIAVVIIFVIAGAKYMMSSGDPAKTKSAKGLIIFGIVGLVIALIAKLIPSVVKLIMGM